MEVESPNWSRIELKIYILIMCANADGDESEEEIELIKSKTDAKTFEKMYQEFSSDSEDVSLKKIELNVHKHKFENMDLIQIRKEMFEVFFTDCNYSRLEKNLDRIMDNIIY